MVNVHPAGRSRSLALVLLLALTSAMGCGEQQSQPEPETVEGTATGTGAVADFDPESAPEVPAEVLEVLPGVLQGYLEREALPNSLAFLPPPPAESSAAFASDQAVAAAVTEGEGRSEERFQLAASDADLAFPHAADTFACALGVRITEDAAPFLYQLLRRALADAGLSTYTAKTEYHRPRPFMANGHPTCTPDDEGHLRTDGSYPSGHAAVGWAWALIFAELAPERADAVFARGLAFGESRIVCNVHWRSDVDQGRVVGAAAVARLHADEGFLSDFEAAKGELAALLAAPGTDGLDCAAEAAVLAGNATEPTPSGEGE